MIKWTCYLYPTNLFWHHRTSGVIAVSSQTIPPISFSLAFFFSSTFNVISFRDCDNIPAFGWMSELNNQRVMVRSCGIWLSDCFRQNRYAAGEILCKLIQKFRTDSGYDVLVGIPKARHFKICI